MLYDEKLADHPPNNLRHEKVRLSSTNMRFFALQSKRLTLQNTFRRIVTLFVVATDFWLLCYAKKFQVPKQLFAGL
jgi:hypothetical protein